MSPNITRVMNVKNAPSHFGTKNAISFLRKGPDPGSIPEFVGHGFQLFLGFQVAVADDGVVVPHEEQIVVAIGAVNVGVDKLCGLRHNWNIHHVVVFCSRGVLETFPRQKRRCVARASGNHVDALEKNISITYEEHIYRMWFETTQTHCSPTVGWFDQITPTINIDDCNNKANYSN